MAVGRFPGRRTVTLARVPSKKKNSRKRHTHRQGLSGNPQRRAQQLQQREAGDSSVLASLAYRLAGGAEPAPWWPESYERILAAARAVAWPSRLIDVETQACDVVGDEFFTRFDSESRGLHPAQWLVGLAEETGAALHASIEDGGGDWEQLWGLLCGLELTAPQPPPFEEDETRKLAREMFPDIRDPYEVAQAEAAKAAGLLTERGLAAGGVTSAIGPVAAGDPVFARDAYGSRVLLTAPFRYGGDEPDHWYAWDIDLCWLGVIVGAGVFGSADDALAEWQDAVGAAASGAALAPCPAESTPLLLDSCLQTGPLSEMLQGSEPRELIREYYRMRRRARALVWPAGDDKGVPFDHGPAHQAFQDWYAARHDDVPDDFGETVATILQQWGPPNHPDEQSLYACSPHRIEMTAHLLRHSYSPEYADEALLVLPEWTQWCISQSGLDGEFVAGSLEAARAAASLAGSDVDADGDDPDDKAPFRRKE